MLDFKKRSNEVNDGHMLLDDFGATINWTNLTFKKKEKIGLIVCHINVSMVIGSNIDQTI